MEKVLIEYDNKKDITGAGYDISELFDTENQYYIPLGLVCNYEERYNDNTYCNNYNVNDCNIHKNDITERILNSLKYHVKRQTRKNLNGGKKNRKTRKSKQNNL